MWAIAILAIAGLVTNIVVHVAAVLGFNPQDWFQPDWLVRLIYFGGSYGILIVMIVVSVRREKIAKQKGLVLADEHPRWFKIVVQVVMVYGLSMGALSAFESPRGDPERWPGNQYVVDPGHGRAAIPITVDVYQRLRRHGARGMSALLIIFYLPMAFDLMFKPKMVNPVESPRTVRRVGYFFVATRTQYRDRD